MSMTDMLSAASAGRSTQGRTPIYRMSISGSVVDVTVQDCTMTMGENMHDTIEMTVTSTTLTSTDGLLEAPVTFLFGLAPRTEVFCGYITTVTEVQNDTGVLTWTMGIVGPTKPMQTGNPRFWTNRTIPSAVEMLSYVSYLGYTGHDHQFIWQALAQADSSDWQMAVGLARRLGWAMYNRFGVVMFYDPLRLFLEQGSFITLISETYTLAKTMVDEERTLLDFEPVEEAESSNTQQGLKVAYFNDSKVQVALQKGDHSNYKFLTDFVVRSAEEAALYVNSDDSDSSNWKQTAKARIMGNASLYPGMSVEVLTTNTKFYPGKFNGRWLVRGVQHKMDKQSFQSNVILARPDGKALVYQGAYAPFWQVIGKAKPTLSLNSMITTPTPVGIISAQQMEDFPTIGPDLGKVSPASNLWVSSWSNSTVRSILV